MTYYAINGSPRKTHNTATILNKALEGVGWRPIHRSKRN